MQQRLEWPIGAEGRLSLREGDALFLSRWTAPGWPPGEPPRTAASAAGFSCPFFVAGPVLGRGIFRLASDPLAFYAWSSVFREPTALVLDSSLGSSRQGVVLSLPPVRGGVFARAHREGTDCGAYARFPLGPGAAAEGLLLSSRPPASAAADEWLPSKSPFPGGEMTHLAARLCLESSRFDASFSTIGSSARWAAPGCTTSLWVRGKSSLADGAILLAASSSPYRTPDGECVAGSSVVSASGLLGKDSRIGTIQAGGAFVAEKPPFDPHREIPCRTVLRLDLSRDFEPWPGIPLSVLLQADKEISRDSDALSATHSRCSGTVCLAPPGMAAKASAGLSDGDGADLAAALTIAPGSRVRAQVVVSVRGLGMPRPQGSVDFVLAAGQAAGGATIRAGIQDYPLRSPWPPGPQTFFRLSLTTVLRMEGEGDAVNPSLRPG